MATNNMALNALLSAMGGLNAGGAFNQERPDDPTRVDEPRPGTPTVGETSMTVTPPIPQTASEDYLAGRPDEIRHANPLVNALSRAGRSINRLYEDQPGTLGTLLGMISKGMVAGKSTYPTSLYQGGPVEKPTVAGMFGDLAMQLGQGRSVEDYTKTGDESHLGLVNPQQASLARDRLDRSKMEKTRQKERKEDIEARDARERRERNERSVERQQNMFMRLNEIESNMASRFAATDLKYEYDKYKANLSAFTKSGGTKQEYWDLIDSQQDVQRLLKLTQDNILLENLGNVGKQRKERVDNNVIALRRFANDLVSGDATKVNGAVSQMNAILASDADTRREWGQGYIDLTWENQDVPIKNEDGTIKSIVSMPVPVFGTSETRPNQDELSEDEKPLDALLTKADADTDKVRGELKQLSGAIDAEMKRQMAPTPAAAPENLPQPPQRTMGQAYEEALRSPEVQGVSRDSAVMFWQSERPMGPWPGEGYTKELFGTTLEWNEELGTWKPVQ